MDNQKASLKKIATNYGLILALASIFLQVISFVTNNHIDQPWWISVLGILISVVIIVYALKAFKKDNSGFLSLSEALKVGLSVSVISALVYMVYFYLFATVIEPEFISQSIEFRNQQMIEQNPTMTAEQIEQASKFQEMFAKPWIFSAFILIGSLFFGFIISLISGLIMKQNRPEGY